METEHGPSQTLLPPRPRKLTLKGYRQHWVVFKETTLSYYKSQEEAPGDPIQQLNLKGEQGPAGQDRDKGRRWLGALLARLSLPLRAEKFTLGPEALCQAGILPRTSQAEPPSPASYPPLCLPLGCEVVPDVNVSGQKFCIKLLVPSPEGMSEIYLRCQDVSEGREGFGTRLKREWGWGPGQGAKPEPSQPFTAVPCSSHPRRSSTPTGWPAAGWPRRAAPWRTVATPARCRPSWPSSACSGRVAQARAATPRVPTPRPRASTPMGLWPHASSGSSRPSRCQRKWVVGMAMAFTQPPLVPGSPQSLPLESHVLTHSLPYPCP